MKNYKLTLFALFMAIGIFGFASCKENVVEPNGEETLSITLNDLGDAADFAFQNGDMQSKMVLLPFSPIEEYGMMGEMGGGHRNHDEMEKRGLGHHKEFGDNHRFGRLALGRVLHQLKLTEEQKAQLEDLKKAQVDCITLARESFHTAMQAIMEEANAAREEIIAKVEAGEMTREEAAAALKELNLATKEKIANSEEMKSALEAMKLCRDNFLSGISGILTEEQLVIWNAFLAKLQG